MKNLVTLLSLSFAITLPAAADTPREELLREAEENCKIWAKEEGIDDKQELEIYMKECIAQYLIDAGDEVVDQSDDEDQAL